MLEVSQVIPFVLTDHPDRTHKVSWMIFKLLGSDSDYHDEMQMLNDLKMNACMRCKAYASRKNEG